MAVHPERTSNRLKNRKTDWSKAVPASLVQSHVYPYYIVGLSVPHLALIGSPGFKRVCPFKFPYNWMLDADKEKDDTTTDSAGLQRGFVVYRFVVRSHSADYGGDMAKLKGGLVFGRYQFLGDGVVDRL